MRATSSVRSSPVTARIPVRVRPPDSFFETYPLSIRTFVWSRGEGRHYLHHAQEYLRQELDSAMLASSPSPVQFVSTVEDAVRDADLAIDCVPDELESKLEILWLMDRMAPPRSVLATPTTRLSITDLASCTYRADRCLGIAVDPRDFSQLQKPGAASVLTLRTTEQTSQGTTQLVCTFWECLGFEVTLERG